MEEKTYKKMKSFNGNEFQMEIIEPEFVSVLQGGYVINYDGDFIPVHDNEDHSNVFLNVLRKYTEQPFNDICNTTEAMIELTKLGFSVYMGMKVSDAKSVYSNGGNTSGMGLLIFPNDLSLMTAEERESCKLLISKNKSVFGNREIMELTCHQISHHEPFTEEELLEILNVKRI